MTTLRKSWRRKGTVPFFSILLLALGLRLWGLGAKSLWMDEVFTVRLASMPFSQMMSEIIGYDAHPPLFQMVEWLWLRFGRGDGYVRVPSVIAGVFAVWLMTRIGRRLFGRNAGWMAGALLALSWFHVYYSQEARLHAIVTTLVLAQLLILLKILARRGRAGWGIWAAYGLAALASLYTYVLCALSVGALGLIYLWRERNGRRQWIHWLAIHGIVGLLFLPWVPRMQAQTARLAESLKTLGDAAGRPSFGQLTSGVASWSVGLHPWEYLGAIGTLLGLGFLIVAIAAMGLRRSRRAFRLLGALFLITLVIYLVMPMPRVHQYAPKHLVFLQPILLLAFSGAWGARYRGRRRGKGGLMPLVLVMMMPLNLYGLATYYQSDFQKENWRGLAADVAPRLLPSDLVLFNPGYIGYPFDHYVQKDAPRTVIETLLTQGALLDPAIRRLWLVECRSPVARPIGGVVQLIKQRGWTVAEDKFYPGDHGNVSWVRFERAPPQQAPPPNPGPSSGETP